MNGIVFVIAKMVLETYHYTCSRSGQIKMKIDKIIQNKAHNIMILLYNLIILYSSLAQAVEKKCAFIT